MNNIEDQTSEALASLARLMIPTGRYTRLISGSDELILDPTDGTAIIADAKDVFQAGIDRDFVNWGCNIPSVATGKSSVQVHEIVEDGTFDQIYRSLGNLDALCLTQGQILQFVQKYRKWLRTEVYGTLFLLIKKDESLKEEDKFFVADVLVFSDGRLFVVLRRLSYDDVGHATRRRRVVIPQTHLFSFEP